MSEMNSEFQVPASQDFDTQSFQGSMQQVLHENIGKYVIVDFLLGTNLLETRQGYLYDVAAQYIVLFDEINLHYVVCDVFTIKFVTFLLPNYRPGQVPALQDTLDTVRTRNEAPAQDGAQTGASFSPAQAAYAYATRRRQS